MQVYNVSQAADYLGIGINKALNMLHSGTIPAIKDNGRWLICKPILDKWLLEESKRQAVIRKQYQNK